MLCYLLVSWSIPHLYSSKFWIINCSSQLNNFDLVVFPYLVRLLILVIWVLFMSFDLCSPMAVNTSQNIFILEFQSLFPQSLPYRSVFDRIKGFYKTQQKAKLIHQYTSLISTTTFWMTWYTIHRFAWSSLIITIPFFSVTHVQK